MAALDMFHCITYGPGYHVIRISCDIILLLPETGTSLVPQVSWIAA